MKQDMIVILDLGSTENTVLARAIRALGVYSEIYPHDITAAELTALPNVKGVIINGGPNHVIDGVDIDVLPEIYKAGIPVMAAGHDKACCEVKLPQLTDDVEAIKNAVQSFVFDTCKAEANWNMTNFVNDQIELIRRQVGDKKVLLALSGGVDSSVVAALLLKAIGNNLVCVHVNHGLMRKGESEAVIEVFKNQLNANLIYVDATDRFLSKLENVTDPEQKRKIIGGEFIRVFEEEARKLNGIDFLGQGTIYPDIVESGTKTAKMVKSHHNVGGLPEDLQFELVEPLRQLFKEVNLGGNIHDLSESCIFAVIPETVGQYTGHTDKNGVMIFKGDIVKGTAYSATTIGVIVWIDEISSFGVRRVNAPNPTAWENSSILRCVSLNKKDEFAAEVIGNIHDNPELLGSYY